MSLVSLQFEDFDESLENADKIWHLQQTGLTTGLSLSQIHTLVKSCTDHIYPKGEVIFRQGEPAENMFILNRGTVRLLVGSNDGKEKIIGLLTTGDIFGEEVLGSAAKRCTVAVAHEESWVSLLNRKSLLDLLAVDPIISLNLARILNRRLNEARDEIESLSFHDTEKRIARTLLKLEHQHGKSVFTRKRMKKLKIAVSHEQIAQLIGANRPHVSAIMSQFKKKGYIDYQKRKLLLDVNSLARIAGTPGR